MTNIYQKIANVQKKIGSIKKDKKNPHFKSSYFDINTLLEALKPHLEEEKLAVVQSLTTQDGKAALRTHVQNLDEDNCSEHFWNDVVLPANDNPQKMGSCITYYRRYALTCIFLLESEDDDGNAAVPVKKAVSKPATSNDDLDF
jgi:hypothetical protein